MTPERGYLTSLLANLTKTRETAGLTEAALEEKLILGPGWIRRFETAQTVPSIDMLLAILHETGDSLADLLDGVPELDAARIERALFAEVVKDGLILHFPYGDFDARYRLRNSKLTEFEAIEKVLRDGLARLVNGAVAEQSEAIKTDAVAKCFLEAARTWPTANPSDLWWFIVYRAYCDPYNHPARFARLDFTQSWKRTGGWALEEILIRHYGPFLKRHGINLIIEDSATKQAIVQELDLEERVESDKIDVVLTGDTTGGPRFFGVVHVKASFAERRTDDVPLSAALTKAGYTSPLWTMDCKSVPSEQPINRGELGAVEGRRSAKRKDIEDDGVFTGCFSYNANTQPSPASLPPERRVHVCDFANPRDAFSRFVISRWRKFHSA